VEVGILDNKTNRANGDEDKVVSKILLDKILEDASSCFRRCSRSVEIFHFECKKGAKRYHYFDPRTSNFNNQNDDHDDLVVPMNLAVTILLVCCSYTHHVRGFLLTGLENPHLFSLVTSDLFQLG
jgi:hypothetical protein